MKKIIVLVLNLIVLSAFALTIDSITIQRSQKFNTELKLFIDKVKPLGHNLSKYYVYIANIRHEDFYHKDFCFTISYIFNENDLGLVHPNYIYYYNGEIVLIIMDENLDTDLQKELKLKRIQKEDSLYIFCKVFPKSKGGITGITEGLTYCQYGDSIKKIFYENSDEIPLDKFIYKYFPPGGKLEWINDSNILNHPIYDK